MKAPSYPSKGLQDKLRRLGVKGDLNLAELGEMLSEGCEIYKPFNSTKEFLCGYKVGGQAKFEPHQLEDIKMFADTEANARAKMLVYLIENKLI